MIDGIFHVINFLLFVGLVVYCFRTYAYAPITQAMILERTEQLNMTKRYEHLRKQEQGLVKVYQHQNMSYEELSQKVALWRDAVSSVELHYEHEREQIIRAMNERIRVQQQYIAQEQVCRSVVPQVMEAVVEDMRVLYADPHFIAHYTHAAIDRMQRRIQ